MDSLIRDKIMQFHLKIQKILDARGIGDLCFGGKSDGCGLIGRRLVADGGVGVFGYDGHGGASLVKGYFSLLMNSMML